MAERGKGAKGEGRGLPQISRRALLTGVAAGGGLAIAWALWPRDYAQQADAIESEAGFGAFLKIDRSGQVIVIVPQAELGQGVFTMFAQIIADELGADWRTVAVLRKFVSTSMLARTSMSLSAAATTSGRQSHSLLVQGVISRSASASWMNRREVVC